MNTPTQNKWFYAIYIWQHSNGDSFASQLLSLFPRADKDNLEKLARAFPEAAESFFAWRDCENDEEFYEMCKSLKD